MTTLLQQLSYTPNELGFGTSGLRGLVEDITDLETYINTCGFILFMEEAQKMSKGAAIFVAGDLRASTPRILQAVCKAVTDSGYTPTFGGLVPTPAISFYALQQNAASIMVTGSHIPADRNGIKFNKLGGEVLKEDESHIKTAVASVRQKLYQEDATVSAFNDKGDLKNSFLTPPVNDAVEALYKKRYTNAFPSDILRGKKIVFYEHSAVGRDIIPEILEALGAEVIRVNRTDYFVPIDTENVTTDDQAYFKQLAQEYPDAFAITSTDGDSDRPFVIDEHGIFHRGDELGAVVASWLKADFAAIPISTSDGVLTYMDTQKIACESTRIGSPYVIRSMATRPDTQITVGWEVNGGFLIGNDIETKYGPLASLPTRDALLPIVVALVAATENNQSISELFAVLPSRYTQAGMIDNFPTEISQLIVKKFSTDSPDTRIAISQYFTGSEGFGKIKSINPLDGIRIFFDNGDIAHLRPSGNAPQLRIYSVADSQERADEIVRLAIQEPDGILRTIEKNL